MCLVGGLLSWTAFFVFLYLQHITGVINRCFITLLILFVNPLKIKFPHKVNSTFTEVHWSYFLFIFHEPHSVSLSLPPSQAWFLFLPFQEKLNHLYLIFLGWTTESVLLNCGSSVLFLMWLHLLPSFFPSLSSSPSSLLFSFFCLWKPRGIPSFNNEVSCRCSQPSY